MAFNITQARIHRFGHFDEVLTFVAAEEKRTFRLPLKGFLGRGAKIIEDSGIGIEGQQFRFNDYSFKALCNLVGTSPDFLFKLKSEGLATDVLNDVIAAGQTTRRLGNLEIVCDDENKQVVGFVSNRYMSYSNQSFLNDVLRRLDPKINEATLSPTLGGFKFGEAYTINTQLYLRITSENVTGTVRGIGGTGDDVSTIGFQASNSMAGGHALRFAYYVHRLICANGLTAPVSRGIGRITHTGSEVKFCERLSNALDDLVGGLTAAKRMVETLGGLNFDSQKLVKAVDLRELFNIIPNMNLKQECESNIPQDAYDKITDSEERKLKKAILAIEAIPKVIGNNEARQVFSSHWRSSASMYDLINIFTAHAKTLTPPERLQAEERAGIMADWIASNKRKFA